MANRIVTQDDLKHVGVLGMHWGIRRFQKKDGHRTPAGRRRDAVEKVRNSEDYINSRQSKKKGLPRLSNSELKKLNERLQLENSYKTLSTAKIEKAQSFVSKSLEGAAAGTVTLVASAVFLAGAKLLVKAISPSFAAVAFPKSK